MKPESLLSVLRRHHIERDWIITAFDRRKTIVARTRNVADFLGRSVSPEFAALLDRGGADGWAVGRTLEGERVYTAYARSTLTGWGIGIGIPEATVDAPLWQSVWAEAAGRAKDEFLAVLSHELRTPLNAVYGWARMLQSGQMREEQTGHAVDVIVRQSNAQLQRHGATFVVTLPAAHDDSGATVGRSGVRAEHPASTRGARLDGVRVLVIDDDRDALDLALAILTAAGATVQVATSSSDGFQIFRSWHPHVVVADIEMPGEDGYTLIRRVRALDADAGGRTPAIALTAYARPKDRDLAVSAGYTMHVPKPVDPGEFTVTIAGLVAPPHC